MLLLLAEEFLPLCALNMSILNFRVSVHMYMFNICRRYCPVLSPDEKDTGLDKMLGTQSTGDVRPLR